MNIKIKKDTEEFEALTQTHMGYIQAISEAFFKIKLNESYGTAVLDITQAGPFAKAEIRVYVEEDGVRLQSNILEWRVGALKEADALGLLLQQISEAEPTVISDYRKVKVRD